MAILHFILVFDRGPDPHYALTVNNKQILGYSNKKKKILVMAAILDIGPMVSELEEKIKMRKFNRCRMTDST